MNDSERDALLIRMDTRQETMAGTITDLKKGMYGEDGQGGLCYRVSRLENFQTTVLAFVTTITITITICGNWIIQKIFGSN